MTSKIIDFDQLTNTELYNCLKLRFEVFVIEQECLYPEYDEIDKIAKHLLLHDDNQLIGYLRIYVDEDGYVKIGRIVTHENHRNYGYGKRIINEAIEFIKTNYKNKSIKISAQKHLKEYYTSFGFEQISTPYLDYGIMHIDMLCAI